MTSSSNHSQDLSPLRAFTLIKGWQGQEDYFVPATSLVTEPFMVAQGRWAIVWSLKGGALRVAVYRFNKQTAAYEQEAVYTLKRGQGVTYIENQGTFYLNIEARGEWIVKAVLVEEVGDPP